MKHNVDYVRAPQGLHGTVLKENGFLKFLRSIPRAKTSVGQAKLSTLVATMNTQT